MFYLLENKKNMVSALIFGVLFSSINLSGRYLENNIEISQKQFLYLFFGTFALTLVIGEVYLRIEAWIRSKEKTTAVGSVKGDTFYIKNDTSYFLLCVLALCLAYIPVFLAYYPGLFAYDVDTQIPQLIEGYSKHHNLIHTLYLNFFYYYIGGEILESYTAGIAWASIVQMVFFSMMLSYVHLFLRRVYVNFKVRVVLIALSALLPFFSVLSVSMTKDVLFAGFVGILAVCLYYWETDAAHYDNKKNQVIYIISLIGAILFRNNGIYAVLISGCAGIVLLGFLKKNFRYLKCTFLGIAASLLISSAMASALSATDGSLNEALSLPYQQLSYVYNTEYEKLTQEERENIVQMLPDVERYNPHLSDPVKANATGAYHKRQLLECYIKLFFKYPTEYMEAFMLNNLGYLYLGDTTHASIYGADLQERSGYLLTDTKAGFGVEHITHFKALENMYENLFSANRYQNIYVLAFLCSPATYFWMIVLLFFYAIDLRRPCLLQFSFVFGFILTVLAGPCALIRYALPYIVCVPVLGVAVLGSTTSRKEEK